MNPTVVATLAVGVPATLIALVAYLASRSKDQQEATRRTVTDLIAPLSVRADSNALRISALEQRVEEIEHDRRRRHE